MKKILEKIIRTWWIWFLSERWLYFGIALKVVFYICRPFSEVGHYKRTKSKNILMSDSLFKRDFTMKENNVSTENGRTPFL